MTDKPESPWKTARDTLDFSMKAAPPRSEITWETGGDRSWITWKETDAPADASDCPLCDAALSNKTHFMFNTIDEQGQRLVMSVEKAQFDNLIAQHRKATRRAWVRQLLGWLIVLGCLFGAVGLVALCVRG